MTPERWLAIGELFDLALAAPTNERTALIDRVSGTDEEVRREVRSLLQGDWAPITFTTTDNFDFTGGEGGQGQDVNGIRLVRPNVNRDPMESGGDAITGWFNTAAFTRPVGRGDIGNSPRNVVQRPGINNWNVALFKNVRFGGAKAYQFRAEVYNVLNHTQFNDVDRNAQFNATGQQVNPNFGTAIGIATPHAAAARDSTLGAAELLIHALSLTS